jgi:transcription antitermination factor NusG
MMTAAEAPSIASIPASFTVGKRWYPVRTMRYREDLAVKAVEALGFEIFMPQEKRWVTHGRKREAEGYPLLRQYFFVRFDINRDQWRRINSTPWVDGLLCQNEIPMRIPDAEIELLQRDQAAGAFDRTIKRKVVHPFKIGEMVRITEGPGEGIVGTVLTLPKSSTGQVTINHGLVRSIKIDASQLEKL